MTIISPAPAPLKEKTLTTGTVMPSSHNGTYKEIGRSIEKFILKRDPDYKENLLKATDSFYSEDHPIRKSDVSVIKEKIQDETCPARDQNEIYHFHYPDHHYLFTGDFFHQL